MTKLGNVVPSGKRRITSILSPFARVRGSKIHWLSDPGPHSNGCLTQWVEAECGVSGGRR